MEERLWIGRRKKVFARIYDDHFQVTKVNDPVRGVE